jgi:hypothetical protein
MIVNGEFVTPVGRRCLNHRSELVSLRYSLIDGRRRGPTFIVELPVCVLDACDCFPAPFTSVVKNAEFKHTFMIRGALHAVDLELVWSRLGRGHGIVQVLKYIMYVGAVA